MKRVLSIGQCAMDHGLITQAINENFGAEVIGADTAGEALSRLEHERFDLVLVNRILDIDGSSGLDLIQQIRAELPDAPVMLVSNYEEHQQQAESSGALPGFGKAALNHPRTLARLKEALA